MGRQTVKITPDTNVLVRAAVRDNEFQARVAEDALKAADFVALPVSSLCELVWVLQRGYKRPVSSIAQSLRDLLGSEKAETNREAAEAGLRMLLSGGDFADGAIACEGRQIGGACFVTFDRKAAMLIDTYGDQSVSLPSIPEA
jgi:predicted nucleic-acid-binding protein